VNPIEGEQVVRQANSNRESAQIAAMMDYDSVSRNQNGQDDRMYRRRCFLGRHLVRTRNPVARTAGRSQFVLTHPVKKVLSGEAVVSYLDCSSQTQSHSVKPSTEDHELGLNADFRLFLLATGH
jgi:hypothetical protein